MIVAPPIVQTIGQLVEKQEAEGDHPHHLHVGIGRQRRGGRLLVGVDQEPVAEAAEQAERQQHQPVKGVGRQRCGEGHDRQHHHDRRQRRIEDQAFGRFGRRHAPGHDDIEAVAERRAERVDVADLEGRIARPRDDQHAGKAGADRRPAPPARPFAEQRSGQRRDDHRREEEDRCRLRQLQRVEREEVEEWSSRTGRAPRSICMRQAAGAEHGRVVPGPEQAPARATTWTTKRIHATKGACMPDSTRYFAPAVEAGEQEDGAKYQEDRGRRRRSIG